MANSEFSLDKFNDLCKLYGRLSLEVQCYLVEHKNNPQAEYFQELTNLMFSLLQLDKKHES
jgi:hypothetical protein